MVEDGEPFARLNRSTTGTGSSRFQLSADTRKGNRPSFSGAAAPERADALYEVFCEQLTATGVPVARGVFGARMAVTLVNDGPVTIILEV